MSLNAKLKSLIREYVQSIIDEAIPTIHFGERFNERTKDSTIDIPFMFYQEFKYEPNLKKAFKEEFILSVKKRIEEVKNKDFEEDNVMYLIKIGPTFFKGEDYTTKLRFNTPYGQNDSFVITMINNSLTTILFDRESTPDEKSIEMGWKHVNNEKLKGKMLNVKDVKVINIFNKPIIVDSEKILQRLSL
jgi:hypothetical protein